MDLNGWLLRRTPPRPLVVAAPGGTAARLAVEREVRVRGWHTAMSPAEANILVVAGLVGPVLGPHVERVWAAFPAPRARVDVVGPTDAPQLLDEAVRTLRDAGRQREQATRPASQHDVSGHTGHDANSAHHDMAPAAHDDEHEHLGHPEHQSHHDQHGHGDHAHHGHDMSGMEMPGGVPMADRAEDRDGLKLDQLHVPLGPALPLWPAGLVVHTRPQGDVIQQATVEVLTSDHDSFWAAGGTSRVAARHLDSSARLLALAGWADAAARACRLRDEALAGASPATLLPQVRAWARRVGKSRTLRRLLAGVGTTRDAPPRLDGDALTRLRRWLDAAEVTLTRPATTHSLPDTHETQWTVDALPALLDGAELAIGRLVVASLDPDLDLLSHAGVHHG